MKIFEPFFKICQKEGCPKIFIIPQQIRRAFVKKIALQINILKKFLLVLFLIKSFSPSAETSLSDCLNGRFKNPNVKCANVVPQEQNETNAKLYQALCNQNLSEVRDLLASGADVNAKNIEGKTPLHYVMSFMEVNQNIVKALLEGGASPNAKNKNGKTPLHLAIEWQNGEITALFLEKGGDPNIKDHFGRNSLYFALAEKNQTLIDLLIQNGAREERLK